MSKSQIDIISELLLQYSAGNYSYQGEISDKVNEYDMIISGINMLGEELEASNVSTEYFSSIFNSVADMVIITDENGFLIDRNISAAQKLGVDNIISPKLHLDDLLFPKRTFESITDTLKSNSIFRKERVLKGVDGIIYGEIAAAKILDRNKNFTGYLVSITDISQEKENEKIILRTIFTTQQNEQKRVADNLHDSLGQELAMAKLMVSNLKNHTGQNEKCLELITTCEEMLDTSISNLRSICYNLMPSVLTRGGLAIALGDMVDKLNKPEDFDVQFDCHPNFGRLDTDLEIVIYRIAQEFISNMIKHSTATKLLIALGIDETENKISLLMKENGQGFDIKMIERVGENRGIQNIQSKTKAFNGDLDINSEVGCGTSIHVKFPIPPFDEKN